MNYALDIIVVIVILWSIVTTWKKGFAKAVLSLASIIVAFFVARAYTKPVGAWLDENVFNKIVNGFLNNAVTSNEQLSQISGSISSFFGSIQKSVMPQQLSPDAFGIQASIESAIDSVAGSISISLSEIAAFILLFIVIMVVCKIAVSIVNAIFSLPVLGALNKGLGLIFGIVKGVFFVFLVCIVVSFIVMMGLKSSNPMITASAIDITYIFKYFYYHNIIAGFLF